MENTEQAIKKFKADAFAVDVCGITIEKAEHGYAKCKMNITPSHLNAAGVVMGGAVYTLADFASAVATNEDDTVTVTLTSSTQFIYSSKCCTLFAEAKMISEGRTVCFFEVTVTDECGKIIAKVNGTGYKKSVARS